MLCVFIITGILWCLELSCVFSLSTGHSWIVLYKGALMNTCRRLLSCNVTPPPPPSPSLPECFLSSCPISDHESGTRALLLWRVFPRRSVTGRKWQYLIYSQRGLCVWAGGGLWFSYVPTLKNIPPRCWRTLPRRLSLLFLSFSKKSKCFFF